MCLRFSAVLKSHGASLREEGDALTWYVRILPSSMTLLTLRGGRFLAVRGRREHPDGSGTHTVPGSRNHDATNEYEQESYDLDVLRRKITASLVYLSQ